MSFAHLAPQPVTQVPAAGPVNGEAQYLNGPLPTALQAHTPVTINDDSTSYPSGEVAYLPQSRANTGPWAGPSGTHTPIQMWSNDLMADLGLDAHNFSHFDFDIAPQGDAWDGGLNHHGLSGLDWQLPDLETASATDMSTVEGSRVPNPEDELGSMEFTSSPNTQSNSGQAQRTLSISSPNHTASLSLMNLATTAIDAASDDRATGTHSRGRNTPHESKAGPAGREHDDVSEWPQDYRPEKSKPNLIEISEFSLDVDLSGEDADGPSGELGDSKAGQHADTQQNPTFVFVDENLDHPSDKPSAASASLERSRSFNKWHVSERSRKQLLTYLQQCCRHPWSLYSFEKPSDSFLTCSQMETLISLFFRKYHPYMPLLHPATFDVSLVPPVLVLVILAVGLVFYAAEVQGCMHNLKKKPLAKLRRSTSVLSLALSETVRMGVIHAFEADQRGFFNIPINQAWVIQQMFAIASGDKRLYKIAERNRGGLVTAVRRLAVLHTSELRIDGANLKQKDEASLVQTWKAWRDREARIRLGWFVFIYDQMFSLYLDLSPMLLHTEITSTFPADDALWTAESAQEWATRYSAKTTPSRPPQKRTFLNTLRRLLQPQLFSGPPLPLNRLEAYILSITLYRIRWDSSKRSVLWEDDASIGDQDDEEENGTSHIEVKPLPTIGKPDGRSTLDDAAANALHGFAEAAARTTSQMKLGGLTKMPDPVALALSVDVQLTGLLSELHFTGPPAFFDKVRGGVMVRNGHNECSHTSKPSQLKDAAGRSGVSSMMGKGAGRWLKTWMQRPANAQAKRALLLASAKVLDVAQASLGAALWRPDALAAQSHICIITVFHAALTMWAYVKFGYSAEEKEGAAEKPSSSASEDEDGTSPAGDQAQTSALTRLTFNEASEMQRMTTLDLVQPLNTSPFDTRGEGWQGKADSRGGGLHQRFIEAWVKGAYERSEDGSRCQFNAAGVAVRVDGVGVLPGHGRVSRRVPSTHSASPGEQEGSSRSSDTREGILDGSMLASRILIVFAGVLKSVHWGQAASFRAILQHMARQESNN